MNPFEERVYKIASQIKKSYRGPQLVRDIVETLEMWGRDIKNAPKDIKLMLRDMITSLEDPKDIRRVENELKLMKVTGMFASAKVATDGFTKVVPLRLKKEGSTRYSIENAQNINDAGYVVKNYFLEYDKQHGVYELRVSFVRGADGPSHIFRGFTFGYGGEGPHGLLEFAKIFGLKIDRDKVLGNDREFLDWAGERGTLDSQDLG